MIYLVVVLILFLLSLIYAWFSLAPWLPTKSQDLLRVNKIADLKSGQTFLDMGCGNGKVCIYIAKNNPSAKVTGIELAFFFYLFTKLRVAFFGPKNLEIVFGDALKYDISNINVLYIFGRTETLNEKLKEKVSKEMPLKAKLISYIFAFDQWHGKEIRHKEMETAFPVYVYTK